MLGVLLVVTVLALPALLQLPLTDLERRRRRAAWTGAPAGEREIAFRGYKVAQVVLDRQAGSAWLAGVTGRAYAADVTAECTRRGCEVPGLDCACGFYAFRDRAAALALLDDLVRRRPDRGYALLTVDLDGRVLEYEHGFRAERQRVHRVELPRRCGLCQAAGTQSDADVLLADPAQRAEQSVRERLATVGTQLPRGSSLVRVVCPAHVPGRSTTLLVSGLRDLLGTEVDRLPTGDRR